MHLETYKNEVKIGMRNKLLHPQKKHLIEHISDDVRTLRKDDVELQKTLLTGRAIKDVLGGDTILSTNASDVDYFSGDALDLDKVIDPSIRYVDVESISGYLNGPLAGTVNAKDGSAMLHTMVVLPSGVLSYDDSSDGEYISSDTGDASYPKSIRQIFYPDDKNDMDAYTRTGTFVDVVNGEPVYSWADWVSLSGRLLRILVVDKGETVEEHTRAQAILNNVIPYTIYELHCGGCTINLPSADDCILSTQLAFEQYANTNYKFTVVSGVSTPDPNKAYYTFNSVTNQYERAFNVSGDEHTQLVAFEPGVTYYTRDALVEWSNIVRYTELVPVETNARKLTEKVYETTLVPSLDTSRISNDVLRSGFSITNNGKWYEESNQAVLYKFEVVDREDKLNGSYRIGDTDTEETVVSSRTWILDADAEALDAISGFAEMIDSHTDQTIPDFIKYGERHFKPDGLTGEDREEADNDNLGIDEGVIKCGYNETLVVSQQASSRGVAKLSISINPNSIVDLSSHFNLRLYKVNDTLEGYDPSEIVVKFVKVPTGNGATPNYFKTYYVYNQAASFVLANGTGHISSFADGVEYYEKVLAPKGEMPVAVGRINGTLRACDFAVDADDSVKTIGNVSAATVGRQGRLWKCLTESYVLTKDTNVQDDGSYLGTPDPNKNYYWVPADGESANNAPTAVSSAELADTTGHITAFSPDYFYYELASDVLPDGKIEVFLDVARNDTLIAVIESDNHIKDKQVIVPTLVFYPDPHDSYVREVDVSKHSFTTRKLQSESTPSGSNDTVPSSESLKTAYETIARAMQSKGLAFGHIPTSGGIDSITSPGIYTVKPGTTITDTAHHTDTNPPVFTGGTLIVFSNSAVASPERVLPLAANYTASNIVQLILGYRTNDLTGEFWWRINNGTSWSPWMRLQRTPVIWDVGSSNEVSAADIADKLRQGPLTVAFTSASSNMATVNLPDPKYHKGDKMQVEAVSRPIKIKYSSYEYTNSTIKDRMLYPLECDGTNWYVITVS